MNIIQYLIYVHWRTQWRNLLLAKPKELTQLTVFETHFHKLSAKIFFSEQN